MLEGGAWTLLHFSGTEPMVRVYGEARSEEALEAVLRCSGGGEPDMSAATAVGECRDGRLGVMVRTATELFVYWQGGPTEGLTLRVTDLTGRPSSALLDGRGWREVPAAAAAYVPGLAPGHLFYVELGRHGAGGFAPLVGAGPVQTPWLAGRDLSAFPGPYHRS